MATRELNLNLAHRNLLKNFTVILSSGTEVDTKCATYLADLESALRLDDASDTVQRLNIEMSKALIRVRKKLQGTEDRITAAESRNDSASLEKLYPERDKYEDTLVELPSSVTYSDLSDTEALSFEIDDDTLEWLTDELKDYVWNVSLQRKEDGTLTTVQRVLDLDEAKAIAQLMRTIKIAMMPG